MEGTRERSIFVQIKNHRLARYVTADDDISNQNIVTIESSTDLKEDWLLFDYLDGEIKIIYHTHSSKRGFDILNIVMELGDDKRTLQMPFFMDQCQHFLKRMENIQYSKPVRIQVGYDKVKDRGFLWVTQSYGNVKVKYTKENPGDLPKWEQKDGRWNRDKETAYWKKMIIELHPRIEL